MQKQTSFGVTRRQFTLGSTAVAATALAGGALVSPLDARSHAPWQAPGQSTTSATSAMCVDWHARIGEGMAQLSASPFVSAAHRAHAAKTCKCPHCGTRLGTAA